MVWANQQAAGVSVPSARLPPSLVASSSRVVPRRRLGLVAGATRGLFQLVTTPKHVLGRRREGRWVCLCSPRCVPVSLLTWGMGGTGHAAANPPAAPVLWHPPSLLGKPLQPRRHAGDADHYSLFYMLIPKLILLDQHVSPPFSPFGDWRGNKTLRRVN